MYRREDSPTEKAGSIVGREVRVGVKQESGTPGFITYGSGLELIRGVINEAMTAEGMHDRRVSELCETTALAVLGRLMLEEGICVDLGSLEKPEESIFIKIRDPGPRLITVAADRTSQA
jgi:hypothetical protein